MKLILEFLLGIYRRRIFSSIAREICSEPRHWVLEFMERKNEKPTELSKAVSNYYECGS